MAALRRHLLAATWMILSLHATGAVLGAAQVCREQAHTHGGVPAPDCPMHHQQAPSPAEPASHHAHHGEAPAPAPVDSGSARLSCHCSGDVLTYFLGQIAVVPPPSSYLPFVQVVALDVPGEPLAVDLWSAPPSPPPR